MQDNAFVGPLLTEEARVERRNGRGSISVRC